jgi:PAS domain S-box-containing protein
MEKLETPVAYPHETVAQLTQELSQARVQISELKQAQAREKIQREQVELEMKTSRQLLQLVMDTLPEAIFWKDQRSVYLGCNQNFAEDAGIDKPENIIGKTDYDLAWQRAEADFFRECDRRVMLANYAEFGIIEPQLQSDGKQAWLETNKAPLHNANGQVIGILGTYQDITARKEAEISLQELNQKLELQSTRLTETLEQLQQSHLQLVQREKMSALGNLVAGVAHEINNPVGFLSGNLRPAQNYVRDLLDLIELYQKKFPEPGEEIEEELENINLEFLQEDLPKVLSSMREGIKRIANISTSLRTFSRADTEHRIPFDLREGLDSTLLILKHRLKAAKHRPAIEVVKQFHEMPAIRCFPGQLNQVFMNLLANAIDALDEAHQDRHLLDQAQPDCIELTLELSPDQRWAMIKIRDNGIGMSEETQRRIFENLFTTKGVGKGTGLGLAIARQVIVEKHGGTLSVNSTLGEGTEFLIKIPVEVA